MAVKQISAKQLQAKMQQEENAFILLDVREPEEFSVASIAGSILIPLNQLQQRVEELDRRREIVVMCHHGIRSQQAAEYLEYCGFSEVVNLTGGIEAWSCQCDPGITRY